MIEFVKNLIMTPEKEENMEEVEKLLGRKLKPTEVIIYNMYKDDLNYAFYKDENGNLIASKN